MASFEDVRRRKQGESAKERVLNRVYSPVVEQPTSKSMFDSVRNRKVEPTMSEQIQKYSFAQPQNVIASAMNNANMIKQARTQQAISAAKQVVNPVNMIQNTINNPPPPKTQYQINKEGIDKLSPYNPIKYYSEAMNWLTQGNPVGQFVSRVGSTPDTIMSGGHPAAVRPDLGPTANKVADVLGSALTMAVPTGAPVGAGPIAAPYNAVDNLVAASPKLQKAESTVSKAISAGGKIKPKTAQAFTREAFREGTAGAIQGPAIALTQGQPTNRELLENAGLGALAGAGLSALPLVTQPIKSAVNNQRVGNALMNSVKSTSLPLNTTNRVATTAATSPGKQADNYFNELMRAVGPTRARKTSLNKILTDIKPVVIERMTPPLENQRELAKWIQNNMGTDIPLNEIRKMDYTQMSNLANDIKNGMNLSQVANQVARDMGYDLEKALSGPHKISPNSLQRGKDSLRMREVVGLNPIVNRPNILSQPIERNPFIPSDMTKFQKQLDTMNNLKQSWFTNLFGDQGLGISAVSSKGSNNRLLTTQDQIVNSSIKNDVQGLKDSAAAQARSAYQNYVDYLSPLKKVGDDTYQSAMDASRANNLANTIARDAFVTPEGQVVGESLQGIFKKVPRGQDKNFVDYLTLRHAETRMGRGERVYDESLNMTPEAVRTRIDTLENRYPGFKQLGEEWDQFNDNVLKYLGVNEGLISEDLYKALREKNPYYAPMRRQFSRSEKPGRNFLAKTTSSSFSGQKAPIKEVSPTGSTRRIVDPRKTTIETIGAWTNAAMRNRTMQSLVNAIKRDPEGMKGIAEIVKGPNDKRNLRDILLDDGIDDFVEALDDDFKGIFKTTKLNNDNVVRAMVDGQPIHIQVNDPEVVKALIGMGPQASNALVDFMGTLSNATKRGATGVFAPIFAVKGATMDLVQSAIQSKNPAKQMAYTVYGILSGIADRLNIPGLRNMAQEFKRAGGEYSAALKGERKLNRQIDDMTRYPILTPKGLAQTTRKAVTAPFKALEAVGDIAENAPRMAAYKLEMNRLGGEKTPDNVRKAMEQAREITVNFSRRGAKTRDIEAFVPYNNAAVQGTFRILRAFKENPVRTMTSIAGLAVLPKLYEYVQFGDDPDYQNLPARERYRFLIVSKNADGTFVKIPMEPAYNSFGELTIEALRSFKDNDPRAFKGMADALANAWLPPAMTGALQGITQGGGAEQSIVGAVNSTVAAPFVAVAANQSFTGGPIVNQGLSDRSPQYQYDERTSSVAKELGKYLKMSPMKVDYLIRAYGGDPARLLLPLTSDAGAGNVRNTLLKNFIVDPNVSNTLSDDFYTARENLTRAYRDNQEVGVELPSWYSDELRKTVTSSSKGSINKQLSELRSNIKEVSADKKLSPTEKTRQLRDLRQQMNKIYIDVNQQLEEAGVPLK